MIMPTLNGLIAPFRKNVSTVFFPNRKEFKLASNGIWSITMKADYI